MASATDTDGLLRPRPGRFAHSQLSHLHSVSFSSGTDIAESDSVTAETTRYGQLGSLLAVHLFHVSLKQEIDIGDTEKTALTQFRAISTYSGHSTPIPADAPPSVKFLSSARKQIRAEQRRRIFPTIEFASRLSHFDPNSDYRDFHGFFNLFWIGLAIMAITTMLRNIKDTGYPLRVQIWALFTVNLWHLALIDFFMVATTSLSLLLQKQVRLGVRPVVLSWIRGGILLQSMYQILWFTAWVAIPFIFDWTWTAQVFLLLHTMALLMKMHSYAFYNGHLSETERRLRALDNPVIASKAAADLPRTADSPLKGWALSLPEDDKTKDDDIIANLLPHKEFNGCKNNIGNEICGESTETEVAQLREHLARELISPMGSMAYPDNLTWTNYFDYLLCPTLCYELEYPRTESVDWQSLFSKITAVFGCIFLLTVTSEEFILPVLTEASTRLEAGPSLSETLLVLAESISWLLFPFMLTFLLVFLVIFEYVLGAFAEITRFADRHFYSDWWNSTDWMEFSREWNIPVYSFLRRHVYSASRPHIGRNMATVITFLISAVGHEIILACITKKLRGYGFVCQMLQLPIVALQRTPWVRGKRTLNNVCFWCSMILGLSLICSLYVLV